MESCYSEQKCDASCCVLISFSGPSNGGEFFVCSLRHNGEMVDDCYVRKDNGKGATTRPGFDGGPKDKYADLKECIVVKGNKVGFGGYIHLQKLSGDGCLTRTHNVLVRSTNGIAEFSNRGRCVPLKARDHNYFAMSEDYIRGIVRVCGRSSEEEPVLVCTGCGWGRCSVGGLLLFVTKVSVLFLTNYSGKGRDRNGRKVKSDLPTSPPLNCIVRLGPLKGFSRRRTRRLERRLIGRLNFVFGGMPGT